MAADAESVVESALSWLREGRRVALATVIKTWSSSPRPVGSEMAIDDAGRFEGSVSGGCVEAAVIDASRPILKNGGVGHGRARPIGAAISQRTSGPSGKRSSRTTWPRSVSEASRKLVLLRGDAKRRRF
jgi:xanthine/CO dehydrogenase XdhC/CoxF family maturation factor